MDNPKINYMDVLSLIIVTHNSGRYILNCLKTIYSFNNKFPMEIIIIDNNSEDDTIEILKKLDTNCKIIRNIKNFGFAKACNQGIKIANGNYVFLLNPDTEILNDAFSLLYNFMEKKENEMIFCVGAQLFNEDCEPIKSFGRFPNLFYVIYEQFGLKGLILKLRNKKFCNKKILSNQPYEVPFVLGCNMFIRKSVLDEIGLFDERFFLNFEETELSWRANKAGYKSMILPKAKILHYSGKSFPDKKNYLSHLWLGQLLFFKLTKNQFIFLISKFLHLFGSAIRWIVRLDNFYLLHLKKIKSI